MNIFNHPAFVYRTYEDRKEYQIMFDAGGGLECS
jgi:hypothetical protein